MVTLTWSGIEVEIGRLRISTSCASTSCVPGGMATGARSVSVSKTLTPSTRMRILPSFPNSKSLETDMRKSTVGLVTVSPCAGESMKMCWAKEIAGEKTTAIKSASCRAFMVTPPLSESFTNCARPLPPESGRESAHQADTCLESISSELSGPADGFDQLRAPDRDVEPRGHFLRRRSGQRDLRVSQLDHVPYPGLVAALGQSKPDPRVLQPFARGNQGRFGPAQEESRLLYFKPHRLPQAIALRLDRDQVVIRLAHLRFGEQPLEDVPRDLQLAAPIPGEAIQRLPIVGEARAEQEGRKIGALHRVDDEALSADGLLDAGEFRPGFQGPVEQPFSRLILTRKRRQGLVAHFIIGGTLDADRLVQLCLGCLIIVFRVDQHHPGIGFVGARLRQIDLRSRAHPHESFDLVQVAKLVVERILSHGDQILPCPHREVRHLDKEDRLQLEAVLAEALRLCGRLGGAPAVPGQIEIPDQLGGGGAQLVEVEASKAGGAGWRGSGLPRRARRRGGGDPASTTET